MNTTNKLLQQLNTMQNEHIKILNDRIVEEVKRYDNSLQPLEAQHEELIKKIEVINEHRQHLNETISNQAEQLQTSYTRIELGKEAKSIDDNTIGKLFAAAKKDKEVIKQFKQLINQQGKQIIDLQKENDSLFAESCTNNTTLQLQKEVKQLLK